MNNPEDLRECECCWAETTEGKEFLFNKEWLCVECYNHAEKILEQARGKPK